MALSLFRMLVQKEIGYKSEEPGYAGLIDEAQNYMVAQARCVRPFSPFHTPRPFENPSRGP